MLWIEGPIHAGAVDKDFFSATPSESANWMKVLWTGISSKREGLPSPVSNLALKKESGRGDGRSFFGIFDSSSLRLAPNAMPQGQVWSWLTTQPVTMAHEIGRAHV